MPQIAVASWHAGIPATFELCEVEAHLQALASGRPLADVLAADTPRRRSVEPGMPRERCERRRGARRTVPDAREHGRVAWLMSWLVDLNEFSLHSSTATGWCAAFWARRGKREPHPFTGFDSRRRPAALGRRRHPTRRDRSGAPYPIYNVALNLVAGKNLAWQQRKAASFIFTPAYCGFEYRDDDDGRARGDRRRPRRSAKADDSGVTARRPA